MGNCDGRYLPRGVPAKELPQWLSNLFIKKVDNIRSDLQTRQIQMSENVPELPTAMSVVLAYFKPAVQEEVRSVIRKAPVKSCKLDPIPTWLLKQCLDELVPLVTAIINRSMETGSVPVCFKCAWIRPLLKKSVLDPEILKNYRPVSNLPLVSKILEKFYLKKNFYKSFGKMKMKDLAW